MTSRNPVIWSEGLFVKPQHFQQQQRALEHHANQRVSAVSAHLYGLSELEINQEYLSFGKIAIVRARGVMPDGSVFDLPNDQAPPAPLAITDASSANQVVYLTLPLKSDGVLEVQWPESYAQARYAARAEEVKDTHSQEGDYVSMDVASLNLQLTLERDDRSAFTGIALCRILDRRPDGSLILDETFYPTSLSLSAIPPLHRFLGETAGLMRERAKNIAERIGSPGQSGVADVTDFNLLQVLNRLQPYFLHLSRLRHVHPEQLYVAFSQACGELVTFTDEGRLPLEYPAYQHDNLRVSFRMLEETLRRSLSTVLQPRAVSLPIIKQQYGMLTAAVQDRSLLASADFILAVRARMPLDTLRQQFVQQAKVASMEKLGERVSLQLPGIPLGALPVAPRYLPFHAGFTYFQLDRTHASWQMMRDTAGFGFHIAGDFPELELQFWAIRSE
ncbi:MAG TPA: type VI secretion system baseplate subunit TssK [Dyella sp.]|uniref:type VI secretion system baseplate subunit TssK n=1 Tax=Dyella sp. TaxID=1869338 RepID=UPI002B524620|nr:type VI secretion system baseplate subunit TssK [Dyella sp.]HTV86026.1 type VI secretion system baseplate subunit TssK [Dyella sp.]